jgi:hypothetical protein
MHGLPAHDEGPLARLGRGQGLGPRRHLGRRRTLPVHVHRQARRRGPDQARSRRVQGPAVLRRRVHPRDGRARRRLRRGPEPARARGGGRRRRGRRRRGRGRRGRVDVVERRRGAEGAARRHRLAPARRRVAPAGPRGQRPARAERQVDGHDAHGRVDVDAGDREDGRDAAGGGRPGDVDGRAPVAPCARFFASFRVGTS